MIEYRRISILYYSMATDIARLGFNQQAGQVKWLDGADFDAGSHRTGGGLKAWIEMGVFMVPDGFPHTVHEIGA
ncbi:hypothetical protein MPC4_20053 [Methylocella tundrae]|uniref:Uncharacterized protein n=1 Tax=Methylocella tundrae TaxID=227605 RepID=A0A8B6M674_METTU|nr:hypothetical protein MPC1_9260002 [Methylocella tundrae]VTZ49843.1 hypothetical protein MPC4_20053 [Methylocella tundrae]